MSLWGAVMGHANMVMHAAGWLEGGLRASFEKLVLDAELLQHMAEFLRPIEVTEETLGLDAIREVGPGGHFFGAAHTLARYETAFYAPMLSDWRNFESWQCSQLVLGEKRRTPICPLQAARGHPRVRWRRPSPGLGCSWLLFEHRAA